MKYLSRYIAEEAEKIRKQNDNNEISQNKEPANIEQVPFNCSDNTDFVPLTSHQYIRQKGDPRLIAFYLPQYHQIKENDEWWGRGFTEWINVTRAIPQFQGHYQPHLPIDLGLYDLNNTSVMARQAELARMYGVYGFCFYYYWFSGKRLLEKPLEKFLSAPYINFPFCLCWANENWTRRWDGAQDLILMEQKYQDEDIEKFVKEIFPYFNDSRYIRFNDMPVLIIYAASRIPYSEKFTVKLREAFKKNGIDKIWLVAALTYELSDRNPEKLGYDAAVEFPMFGLKLDNINEKNIIKLNDNFKGVVRKYDDIVISRQHLKKSDAIPSDFRIYRTALASFDNTARRMENATIVMGNPQTYRKWLDDIILETRKRKGEDNFVFLHAWNEWAEGSHLEPDRQFGYSYLSETKEAVVNARFNNSVSVICFVKNKTTVNIKTLNSLLSLNYKNKQLIVVYFNGEQSDCGKDYKDKLKDIYSSGVITVNYFKGTEREALNSALSYTTGQWIMTVSNDDIFEPNRIDSFIETVRATDTKLVFSKATAIENTDKGEYIDQFKNLSEYMLIQALVKEAIPGGIGNIFFNRCISEKLGGFSEYKHLYDYDFMLKACLFFRIAYTGSTVLYYSETNKICCREEMQIYADFLSRIQEHRYKNSQIDIIAENLCKYLSYYCTGKYFKELRYALDTNVSNANHISSRGWLDSMSKLENFVFHVNGWCIVEKHDSINSSIYLRLSNEKNEYYFYLPSVSRADVTTNINDGFNYDNSGFNSFICTYGLQKGIYGISLIIKNKEVPDTDGLFATDSKIEI